MSLVRKPPVASSGLPSPSSISSSSKETWTITCYSCGMPSSSVWAKIVRCHPPHSSESNTPYYPSLLELPCPNGAVLTEDGTTYLCAFCFASLESQWSNYEKQTATDPVHPKDRKFNLQKFVCAVCGVQTYRKRIRALPFQEFPFLTKDRQPGSLTLGQNPLAIVCLDCSETLWAQSAEYERWGLPIQKRHFNWMARPPPPENSMEATVARLPSGETQLPRCPPIEPSVSKGRPHLYSELIGSTAQSIQAHATEVVKSNNKVDLNRRNYKSSSSQHGTISTNRKSSVPCLSSSVEHAQFPPVVTVAPMSSYKDSMSVRKGSSVPSTPDLLKADSNGNSNHSSESIPAGFGMGLQFPPSSRPVPSFLESPAYKALQWYPREFNYSYGSLEASQAATPWPWIPTPHHGHGTEFMNYQSYLANLASRNVTESYVSPSSGYNGSMSISASATHLANPLCLSTSPYSTVSFLSPASVAENNGHYSPRTMTSHHSGTFLPPLPSNSNGLVNKHMSPQPQGAFETTNGNVNTNKHQPLKRKGSLTNNCEIPSKSRPMATMAAKDEIEEKAVVNTRAKDYVKERCNSDPSEHLKESTYSSYPHFKKRWNWNENGNGGQNSDTELAVDLSKKCDFVSPASSNTSASTGTSITPTRSSSFSIAFLCNNDTVSPPLSSVSQASASPKRGSEALSPAELKPATDVELTSQKSILNVTTGVNLDPETSMPDEPKLVIHEESPFNKALKMSDLEVKDFVEKAKVAYRFEERKRREEQKRIDEKKEEFLKPLNLITTKQAAEIELQKTISRAEKRTLAPLQLRPNSPNEDIDFKALIQKEIRRALSENKYSNMLESNHKNPDQQNFLENLNLKTNSESEKLKIEQQWCLTLLEKLLRVSRNGAMNERKWNTDEISKLAGELANICRVDSANGSQHNEQQFTNLSLILSPEAEDLLTKQGLFNSSDLLSIVNGGSNGPEINVEQVKSEMENEVGLMTNSKLAIIQPVISYPTYIPSYAVNCNVDIERVHSPEQDKFEPTEQPHHAVIEGSGSILNIPCITRHSCPDITSPDPTQITLEVGPAPTPATPSICIPKIPLRRSSSESAHCENQNPEQNMKPKRVQRKDSSEGKLVQVNTNTGTISKNCNHVKQTADAEEIVGRYTEVMKGLRNEIDNLLSSSVSVKEDRNGETYVIDQIRKLRSALATYQADMKLMERKLRKEEKEILRACRLSSSNGIVGLEKGGGSGGTSNL